MTFWEAFESKKPMRRGTWYWLKRNNNSWCFLIEGRWMAFSEPPVFRESDMTAHDWEVMDETT